MIEIITQDNIPLRGRFYHANTPKAVIMLNPGTATKTSFYIPFAQFLADNGFHVFLWNYRGFCESATGSLVGKNYKFSDIGLKDIPAVIDYLTGEYPDLPLYCVGHSVGGQQIGLAYNHNKLSGLISVGSSAGYFPNMPILYRIKANFFFRIYAPVTSLIFKYVPAKRLNIMEDLPSTMVKEWGDWCMDPAFLFSDKFYGKTIPDTAFKNLDFPIHVISADDDQICTPKNLDILWSRIKSQKPITFKQYQAADTPQKTIGHFGYLRRENTHIWNDILQKLNDFADI